MIRGGRVLSVFTREWLETDVAVVDGRVAGLGDYEGEETLDASGRDVVPGFIDAHMHLETTKLLVDEFARLVLPLGTTSVVVDPHEIANVLGTDGVHWLLDVCGVLPLDVYFMASSSVPASRFESPRRPFSTGDLEGLLRRRRVKSLNAYAAAGICSDHETFTIDEGRERLRAGMWLLVREASAARNLQALIPLAKEFGPHRIAFCTDDREPEHIAEEVVSASNGCIDAAAVLGCALPSPFQTMAFLALSVIPSLKITDQGLVDVDRFELVPLRV